MAMRYLLLVLTFAGLAATTAIHLWASAVIVFTDHPGPSLLWPAGACLLIAVIPLSIFAMLLHGRGRFLPWAKVQPFVPPWMNAAVMIIFVYTGLSFIAFIVTMPGVPLRNDDGSVVLRENFSRTTHPISQERYRRVQLLQVRGFTGHALLFYAVDVVVVLAAINRHRGWRPASTVSKRGTRASSAAPT